MNNQLARQYEADEFMTPGIYITVSSNQRQIGKTTTAKLIGYLLRTVGFEVEFREPNEISQRYLERMPLDLTKLNGRRIVITST